MEELNIRHILETISNQMMNSNLNGTEGTWELQYDEIQQIFDLILKQLDSDLENVTTIFVELWKIESYLQQSINKHTQISERLEVSENRVNKLLMEAKALKSGLNSNQFENAKRDERIQELENDLINATSEMKKKHKEWEQSERERLRSHSVVVKSLATLRKLKQSLSATGKTFSQAEPKPDSSENLVLGNCERLEGECANPTVVVNAENVSELTGITATQFAEIQRLYETAEKRNQDNQKKIDMLQKNVRVKDYEIRELKMKIHNMNSQKLHLDGRINSLEKNVSDYSSYKRDIQRKFLSHHQQLVENTNHIYQLQEEFLVVARDLADCQISKNNLESKLKLLKAEHSNLCSKYRDTSNELLHVRTIFKKETVTVGELSNEIFDIQNVLSENAYKSVQREFRYKAILAQHKSHIDYLQQRVDKLSRKKKKMFNFHPGIWFQKNRTIPPTEPKSPNSNCTLQEGFLEEKQPLASLERQSKRMNDSLNIVVDTNIADDSKGNNHTTITELRTLEDPHFRNQTNISLRLIPCLEKRHSFKIKFHGYKIDSNTCIRCLKKISIGPYWKCNVCSSALHRKCRNKMTSCAGDNRKNGRTGNSELNTSQNDCTLKQNSS